jgi:DNA-binding transcriptional ArsR family regulator
MGTVRIHFTGADLARTHIAAEPDPFWEMVTSLHVLQGEDGRLSYPEWRRTLPRGEHRVRFAQMVRTTLAPVAPAGPYFPDFVTPIEGLVGFEEGLDVVLSTPRRRVRQELARVSPLRGSAGWVAALADGRAKEWSLLGDAMRSYFDHALAPHWPTIRARIRAEYMVRSRLHADQGMTGLLASMRPTLRWEPPVLELNGPSSRDIHLNGRGLTLIPSYFNWHNPMTMYDPELPPVVIYPAARLGGLLVRPDPASGEALADLLGSTRAAALRAIAAGCTTTELAREIGVSRSTASEHATVLRRAGLITTRRDGLAVWHALTALGAALLSTDPAAASPRPSRPA